MIPCLLVAIVGMSLRIIAFFTCRNNFTHLVRLRKNPEHRLVTNGIYSVLRHPGYTGFYYFSVFSQLFLGNFFVSIAFAVVLSRFFDDRIEYE